MSLQRPTHVRNVIKLPHKGTNDRGIMEPALFSQTVRTFSRLVNVYHEMNIAPSSPLLATPFPIL
jgi:hypothetical protein